MALMPCVCSLLAWLWWGIIPYVLVMLSLSPSVWLPSWLDDWA